MSHGRMKGDLRKSARAASLFIELVKLKEFRVRIIAYLLGQYICRAAAPSIWACMCLSIGVFKGTTIGSIRTRDEINRG